MPSDFVNSMKLLQGYLDNPMNNHNYVSASLRITEDLKKILIASANKSARSLNQEVLLRLIHSYLIQPSEISMEYLRRYSDGKNFENVRGAPKVPTEQPG